MYLNRDNAKRLVYENDMLQMQMSSTEKDTLDVISYLKQEDGKKDEQVCQQKLSLHTCITCVYTCTLLQRNQGHVLLW